MVGRRSRRWVTAAVVVALVAAGVTGYAAWHPGRCVGGNVSSDVPARTFTPSSADGATPEKAAVAELGAVGVTGSVRWGFAQPTDEPSVVAGLVDGATVTTVQETGALTVPTGSGSGTGSSNATVLAGYDAATGARRWQVGGPDVEGSVRVVAAGAGRALVVVPTVEGSGSVSAVDEATGAVAWCVTGIRNASLVSVASEQVLLSATDDGGELLRALDPATGAERWRRADDPPGPVRAGDVVLARSDTSQRLPGSPTPSGMTAVDARSGRDRWTAAQIPLTAAGGDDVAVVAVHGDAGSGNRGSALIELDSRTGATRWTRPLPPDTSIQRLTVVGTGALARERLGPTGAESRLELVDVRSGAPRWSAPDIGTDPGDQPPLLVDGGRRLVVEAPGDPVRPVMLESIELATGRTTTVALDPTRFGAGDVLQAADPAGRTLLFRHDGRVSVLRTGG